jgi:hypothetical protein
MEAAIPATATMATARFIRELRAYYARDDTTNDPEVVSNESITLR